MEESAGYKSQSGFAGSAIFLNSHSQYSFLDIFEKWLKYFSVKKNINSQYERSLNLYSENIEN